MILGRARTETEHGTSRTPIAGSAGYISQLPKRIRGSREIRSRTVALITFGRAALRAEPTPDRARCGGVVHGSGARRAILQVAFLDVRSRMRRAELGRPTRDPRELGRERHTHDAMHARHN